MDKQAILDLINDHYEKRLLYEKRQYSDFYHGLETYWDINIPGGWYGFEIADQPIWLGKVINDLLLWVSNECPKFEIHQIKMKFGSIRIYLENITHEIEMLLFFAEQEIDKRNHDAKNKEKV